MNSTCPSGWTFANGTTCLKIIPKTSWYEASQACMNEGGQFFDAGGKQWLVSAAAKFLAKQWLGASEYFWVNAFKVSVNNQGKVWTFKDGKSLVLNTDSDILLMDQAMDIYVYDKKPYCKKNLMEKVCNKNIYP